MLNLTLTLIIGFLQLDTESDLWLPSLARCYRTFLKTGQVDLPDYRMRPGLRQMGAKWPSYSLSGSFIRQLELGLITSRKACNIMNMGKLGI